MCGNSNSSREVLEVHRMSFLFENNNLPIRQELERKLWSNYRGFQTLAKNFDLSQIIRT